MWKVLMKDNYKEIIKRPLNWTMMGVVLPLLLLQMENLIIRVD